MNEVSFVYLGRIKNNPAEIEEFLRSDRFKRLTQQEKTRILLELQGINPDNN